MGVFPGYDANLPTQLWIAARYLESFSLVLATLFLSRTLRVERVIAGYAVVVSFLLATIFVWGIFPDCFVEGSGLTPFKIVSEYVISATLICAMILLWRCREQLDRGVLESVIAAIAVTACSELAFTLYVHVYGIPNMIGHLLKVVSVYLIYRAFIQAGLRRPYDLLVRDLHRGEQALRERVKELTCLYGMSRLIERPGISLDEIAQGTVDLIPPAWRHSEIACARINLNGREFTSERFAESEWRLGCDIVVRGREAGRVEVSYLKKRSDAAEGPFLGEERHLIDAIAGRLGRVVERERAERALRESETMNRAMLQGVPDLVFRIGRDGTILDYHAADEQELVATPERFLGRSLTEVLPADVAGKRMAAIERALADDGVQAIDYALSIGGEERHYDDRVMAIGADQVVVVARDITERKRAEEREREQARLNQTLLDAFPCVALLLRPSTREIVASNRAVVECAAVPGEQCFATWGQRDDPCPWCLATELWNTGEPQHLEVEALDIIWDAHWIPITPDLYLHYAFDITEQVRLEERLREAEKMEVVGRLAGGIAHEFNNLLTIVNGYSGIVLRTLGATHPSFQGVSEITKAGHRAAELTSQLLAFGRKQMLQMRVIDLNTVLSEMSATLMPMVREDISLDMSLAEGLGPVRSDPRQIQQVVLNLAANARDAMPTGGRLAIATSNLDLQEALATEQVELRPGRYVVLEVADTGHGMTAEVMEHLFEPFFTTKEVGKGTGLGLAMVYGTIKQLGGETEVQSQPGEGTTFRIYLPREESAPQLVEEPKPQAPAGSGQNILVVEDDDAVRRLVVRVLGLLGYSAMPARDAASAIEICQSSEDPIALVLIDVVMPNVNGPELAAQLRVLRPDLGVLYMTGHPDDVLVSHGVIPTENTVVHKPFRQGELAAKVRLALAEDGR